MDAVRGMSFGSAAHLYARGRPPYPRNAVTWVLPPHPRRVLDLAAGTGKLTAVLLGFGREPTCDQGEDSAIVRPGSGIEVVAVEPDDAMRAHVPEAAQVLAGSAEAIPLEDGSVDAVLVAQAFHWFDQARALTEIARVLRPGGTLGLMWNAFDDGSSWVGRLAELVRPPDQTSEDQGVPFSGRADLSEPEGADFAHTHRQDVQVLLANVASRSHVIALDENDRVRLLAAVEELAPAGEFDLAYVTHTWRATRLG